MARSLAAEYAAGGEQRMLEEDPCLVEDEQLSRRPLRSRLNARKDDCEHHEELAYQKLGRGHAGLRPHETYVCGRLQTSPK